MDKFLDKTADAVRTGRLSSRLLLRAALSNWLITDIGVLVRVTRVGCRSLVDNTVMAMIAREPNTDTATLKPPVLIA